MIRLREDFCAAGLTVWTDEGIEPGTQSWQRAIEAAIVDAGCMVCVLSPDAYSSNWVREELNFAKLHNKYIFPVLARGDEQTSLPFGFTSSQWVDIREDEKHDLVLKYLIQSIHKRISSTSSPKPIRLSVPEVLPAPFEWCEVPAGKVTLEDVSGLGGTKGGTSKVDLFFIAKDPITNAQYQIFLDDENGYQNTEWWEYYKYAASWHKWNSEVKLPVMLGKNLPRTIVSWFDAMAFCRWLSHKTHLSIKLPTERQWQRAAQGDDNRIYPWGNEFSPEKCNGNREWTDPRPLTPVDKYLGGSSPYGVVDMTGNVNEWCLDVWRTGSTSLENREDRVAKGGSWAGNQFALKVTMRQSWLGPWSEPPNIGFRIAYSF